MIEISSLGTGILENSLFCSLLLRKTILYLIILNSFLIFQISRAITVDEREKSQEDETAFVDGSVETIVTVFVYVGITSSVGNYSYWV